MKRFINITVIVLIFVFLVIFFGKLTSYKYIEEFPEGSFTRDYYQEKYSHDVIFLGDCEAYSSYSPMVLYSEYGITSYVRGNSQQLIGQSYYILRESLKYEKPKIVVLSVGAMRYPKQVREEYNRLLLDDMKLSYEKLMLINDFKLENESLLSYLFSLLRYHNRIFDLKKEDFTYLFKRDVISHNGFLINKEVKPLTKLPAKKVLDNYDFSKENFDYLEKITKLCKKENIELILVKSPTVYPFWYDEYNSQIVDFANKHNLKYINMLDYLDDIGIDYTIDTYDSGVHLNLSGATKYSKYFGNFLKGYYNLSDYRNNDTINKEYKIKLERYNGEVNEKDT